MTSGWPNLPEELLDLILSNLYAQDRLTFGLVCRVWNSVAKCSTYRNTPCLMFYDSVQHSWRFFQYNGFFDKVFPQLYNAEICCSKYGWLLMSRDDMSLFFFHPFKKQRIQELPKFENSYSTICFFNEPTSSNCVVVGISNFSDGTEVRVLRHGKDEWDVHAFCEFQFSLCTPILHCGTLYILNSIGDVAAFDLNDIQAKGTARWTLYDRCLPSRLRHKIKQQYLIKLELEKVLIVVIVAHDERKVIVYRWDLEDNKMQRWKLVKDLGNRALFVSHTCSIAVTATSKIMENKIYFTKLYEDSCIYYCLNTQKYHSIDRSFSSNKCYRFKESDFATWILPTEYLTNY